ncbi:hypothetical protein [Lacibacter sediminis]|uniref:Uncharacterized protein n=1 Tax=Lacibacter sediminis TaxID=2760713 RepID=A0A7G5XB25_9BACT|nr:hypothetical protein [Lacibacter sediminis]QNA42678.1 hypothetical protein H4075_11215 [Lacibacter sediminis]
MVTTNALLIIGVVLSIALIFSVFMIITKSRKIRSNTILQEQSLDDAIKILTSHFYENAIKDVHKNEIESAKLKTLFEKELLAQFLLDQKIYQIQSKQSRIFKAKIDNVLIANAIIDNLKEREKNIEFIKRSASLYINIAKIITLLYYLERKESQINLDFSSQNFQLDKYRFRIEKDIQGSEQIFVEE